MPVDAALASAIVWLDALVGNVDRTARNVNMLWWHRQLWLIDHGAALVFQHQWDGYLARSTLPFMPIKDHVLLPLASALAEADAALSQRLTPTAHRRHRAADSATPGWPTTRSSPTATHSARPTASTSRRGCKRRAPLPKQAIRAHAQL